MRSRQLSRLDVLAPLGILVLTVGLALGVETLGLVGHARRLVAFGPPLLAVYLCGDDRRRFALGLVVLLGAGYLVPAGDASQPFPRVLASERSFFGVHRLTQDPDGRFLAIQHGGTLHGLQFTDPARWGEPLVYYHRQGPLGRAMRALEGDPRLGRVALIGLGCGSSAAYCQPGQRWTFFEIDPVVVRWARQRFHFLEQAEGEVDVVLGDGRLQLARTLADGEAGLLVVDAFSSDAIPAHLLTLEAFQLYFDKLSPEGVILLHISNRYLDLAPVLAAAAQELGLAARGWRDVSRGEDNLELFLQDGRQNAHWVALARDPEHLSFLRRGSSYGPWRPLPGRELAPWRDSYSHILAVLGKDG